MHVFCAPIEEARGQRCECESPGNTRVREGTLKTQPRGGRRDPQNNFSSSGTGRRNRAFLVASFAFLKQRYRGRLWGSCGECIHRKHRKPIYGEQIAGRGVAKRGKSHLRFISGVKGVRRFWGVLFAGSLLRVASPRVARKSAEKGCFSPPPKTLFRNAAHV